MARSRAEPRPSTATQKRQRTSIPNDDSPSKKLANDTARIDLTSSPGNPDPVFDRPFRNSTSEARRSAPFRPTQGGEETSDTVPSTETDGIKVETFSRANSVNSAVPLLDRHVIKLIELITALRDKGIERLAQDLPQIVVVGDQSTGKSSLIEGLSAIKVPRNEGTCTRCPIEINLKGTSSDWHCRISIVKKYGYKVQSAAHSSLGLGPYNVEFPSADVEHFANVTDKNEIPIWLARAQLAVLNPSIPIKTFAIPPHQNVDISTTQEPFSPNVIRLEISAPGLPSLSFFDLPGVVVQDVDMDSHVPNLIRTLVKNYIMPPKSLVLLTVPIDNDRANSSAADLVFKAKAKDRTVGIISKPDRLAAANVQQWREILAGEKFPFRLGYRVVKNPADPDIDHTEARRQEKEFFSTDPIFCGPLDMFQDRFGTTRLQEFLSKHLMIMISECLPEIMKKIEERQMKIDEELNTLPKPPSGNVYIDVQGRLLTFERQLGAVIDNSAIPSSCPGWFQRWHKEAQAFFEKLVRTAPELDTTRLPAVASSLTSKPKVTNSPLIVLDDDSNPALEKQASVRTNSTGQISTPVAVRTSFDTGQNMAIDATVRENTKKFSLHELRDSIHAVNGGVYGIGDPRVFEELVKKSTKHWFNISREFRKFTARICAEVVNDLVGALFADFLNTALLEKIRESVRTFLRNLEIKQSEISKRLFKIECGECSKLFTLDCEAQEISKRSILVQLEEQIQDARIQKRIAQMKARDQRFTNKEERKIGDEIRAESNPFYQEVNELAGAIAYYKIAARRYADNICLTLRNEFFLSMKQSLWHDVSRDLGIDKDADPGEVNEHLKQLTAPCKKDADRRRVLEHELIFLDQTKKDVMDVVIANQPRDTDDLYDSDEMEM